MIDKSQETRQAILSQSCIQILFSIFIYFIQKTFRSITDYCVRDIHIFPPVRLDQNINFFQFPSFIYNPVVSDLLSLANILVLPTQNLLYISEYKSLLKSRG